MAICSMHDLVVEDANWLIRFLVLSAGSWFEGQKLLVATRWVGSVSWANNEVFAPHSRDSICRLLFDPTSFNLRRCYERR